MSYKIAHISDTHIKNLKYHQEYREVFQQIYERLRKEKPDYILHLGDLAHTKTSLSPEYFELASDFLKNLADIAPTHLICGNHDGNLKNSNRQDAITPIALALEHPNLFLHKNAGEVILTNDLCLNVLSVFDRDNWVTPSDLSKINIALYHGSIVGSHTDKGWMLESADDPITIFDGHDFAFLGDIHRCQSVDEAGRYRYCGSTIQQNHGETDDKGLLIWDIDSKNDWDITPIAFKNPKPFLTVELTPKGRIPKNTVFVKGCRLRLVSNNNLPLDVMRRAIDIARHKFEPESLSFLNRAQGSRGSVNEIIDDVADNLRDITVQEELIDEYLKDYQVDSNTLERVYELNRKYKQAAESEEDISRNVKWKLKTFEWSNLFNYGEGNKINFDSLGGIVGILGKNFSGKSSIIDGILYTMFNTTSKNERKNLNIINQNKDDCMGKLVIEIDNKTYTIVRQSEKYVKKLKGEETTEAKTIVDFEVYDQVTREITSLNGTTRNQTDAIIRKVFGAVEDFLVSSMASQHGALTFIEEGSTRRKEIIAKFLDLEIFERKYKLAKEDSVTAKALLKKHSERNYGEEIGLAKEELTSHKNKVNLNKKVCTTLKSKVSTLTESLITIQSQIESAPNDYIDIVTLRSEKEEKEREIQTLVDDIALKTEIANENDEKLVKIQEFLSTFNIAQLEEDNRRSEDIANDIDKFNSALETIGRKSKLLDGIPCSDSFPTCKFIKDASIHVLNKGSIEKELSDAESTLEELNPKQVTKRLSQVKSIQEKEASLNTQNSSLRLDCSRSKNTKISLEQNLKEVDSKIEVYELNKEAIEDLESLLKSQAELAAEIEAGNIKIEKCDDETLELVKSVGSCEQKIENLKGLQKEKDELSDSYTAYDLFLKCMHPNGIAYDIIKKRVPTLNQEIAKILANIVEFEVSFESSGNKLDIFIKHPKYDARPLEMGSGAEKSIAAIAIRLALLSVSSLPVSNLMVLDEPATSLDEDNMEGFIRILELIKMYFEHVLLISHLDTLKDCVDKQIVIDTIKGFAKVNE